MAKKGHVTTTVIREKRSQKTCEVFVPVSNLFWKKYSPPWAIWGPFQVTLNEWLQFS